MRKPDYAGGRQGALFMPEITWRPPVELPSLKGVKRIAIDVETKDPQIKELGAGVRRPGNYIVGLALGTDDGRRFYFPTRHEGGGNLDEGLVQRWARKELNNFTGEVLGARLIYDLDWLSTWGVRFPDTVAFHDVQVAEPLIDEWRFSYGLDALAQDYLGEHKFETVLREACEACGYTDYKSNLWRLPAGYVGAYAEGDVDLPLRIFPLQYKKMEEENLLTIYDVERKLMPLLVAMQQRGVRVDVKRAETVRVELKKRLDDQIKILRSFAGPKAELNAPDSFVHALDERGIVYPVTPKLRQPSIKKPWLEKHLHDPMCASIFEGRKLFTIINTFLDGHILKHGASGRIHAEINQLKGEDRGTIARFSYANPNLQNVPARDGEMAPLIRGIFLPDEDCEWGRKDYSQIEYRLLVHFAVGTGAEEARELYRNDPKTDFHKLVAAWMGIDPEDKIRRKRVKNVNFAKGYGAQVPKLAETMGCSLEDAQIFVDLYEEKLPFTKETFDAAARWAGKRGFVVSILNRRQRFKFWEPIGLRGKDREQGLPEELAIKKWGNRITRSNTYMALNRKMQSSCADIIKKAMVDGWEAGVFAPDLLGVPFIQVHDELDLNVPRTAQCHEADAELTQIMQNAVKLNVPVIVDSDRGADWGACL